MWLEHFPAGQVTTLTGDMRQATAFLHEVMGEATPQGDVLYVDGGHCFNPYAYAEYNLLRDRPAVLGAARINVIRAMTAYQWHQCLSNEVQDKLERLDGETLVLVNPYDALLTHSDLEDWEAEAYTRVTLRDLQATAKLHHIPIVLLTNFERLWRHWPSIAMHIHEHVPNKLRIESIHESWRLSKGSFILEETRRIQRRLIDFWPAVFTPEKLDNPVSPIVMLHQLRRPAGQPSEAAQLGSIGP